MFKCVLESAMGTLTLMSDDASMAPSDILTAPVTTKIKRKYQKLKLKRKKAAFASSPKPSGETVGQLFSANSASNGRAKRQFTAAGNARRNAGIGRYFRSIKKLMRTEGIDFAAAQALHRKRKAAGQKA